MNSSFTDLTSPFSLGPKTAPCRIVFGSHRTNFGHRNNFNDRHRAYYAQRAKGGAGIIVLEGSIVHPSDWPYEYALFGYQKAVIEGYRTAAEEIRPYETLVLAHLTHSGGQGTSHYSQRPLWAPSPIQEVNSGEIPKEMEEEDINAIVAGFGLSATYTMRAGLDGVEINAGQKSLIRQFLSPMTNHRQDQYGGGLENRLRFARQIIQAVREGVGADAIVGLRLSADEYAPWAGIKPEDALDIAQILDRDGLLDFISVTSGGIYSMHNTRAGLYKPPGYGAHLAKLIKSEVQVPVVAQGSIVDPEMAATLIGDSQVDAVEMTRALIADPDLPRKIKGGPGDGIRPCILCNQDCIVETVQNPPLRCSVNPAAGHEGSEQFGTLQPALVPRRVMIIGGGPAGLEAARIAASRGHEVSLYERDLTLGGSIHLAASGPGRDRFSMAVGWLEAQIRKLGVRIITNVNVTLETVEKDAPDVVIAATGGKPASQPDFKDPGQFTLNPRQVLNNKIPAKPGKAVLLDLIGDQRVMILSEWLLDRGWQVEIVSPDLFVGQGLTSTLELTPWYERAYARGVLFHPQAEPQHFSDRTLIAVDRFSRREIRISDVDLVVNISHEVPNDNLFFQLKESRRNVRRIGDCVAPRSLGQAILEGNRAGRSIS
jgi:mycofactocin system FadH/OYE family oxidoreductase 2